jgi:hypothetical protein
VAGSFKALCVGTSQTGKSTFALHLALETGKQVIVWDANEVFVDIVESPVTTPDDLQEALEKKEPLIVYDASDSPDADYPAEFKRFAKVMENFDEHTLLVDEAADVQSANSPNAGLDRLYRRAGRRHNDIIETTHKPQQVATLNRTLTTDIFIFGISRGADVQALGKEFSMEAAEEASQLPDFVYIHYHTRTGEFKLIDDPDSWFINLKHELPDDLERRPSKMSERRPIFEERE